WYGGIFGVTQIAYLQGVYSFFTQGLFWYVAYFAFAVLLARKIRRHRVLSLPELIGQKFGDGARKFAAVILFFHALPVTYAISVGLLLKLSLGLDFFWAMVLGVAVVAIYTSLGGFRSVVITDCLQFILMFAAVIMVIFACFTQIGGVSFLTSTLPARYFSWQGEHQVSTALVWLFIACTSTFIHPVFYQRCLAAKSDGVAVKGIFIAMIFWLLFDVCTTLGGMYARAVLPNADSSTAYLVLGMNLLPHGLRGLFLTGVLATILSTLDSFMFVSGTSFSYDLVGKMKFFRGYEHPVAIVVSAFTVVLVGAIFESNFEPLWLFMEGAFSTSMMVPAMASVLLKRRMSDYHFLIPSIFALIMYGSATVLQKTGIITLEPFYLAHGTALTGFLFALKTKTQGQAEITKFADG
ncbi:MAG TPA: hypothetical protein VEL47_07405, partial [Myxococcota bacterium]|nr:hypothetical protein [Myxococcota bacterium]